MTVFLSRFSSDSDEPRITIKEVTRLVNLEGAARSGREEDAPLRVANNFPSRPSEEIGEPGSNPLTLLPDNRKRPPKWSLSIGRGERIRIEHLFEWIERLQLLYEEGEW